MKEQEESVLNWPFRITSRSTFSDPLNSIPDDLTEIKAIFEKAKTDFKNNSQKKEVLTAGSFWDLISAWKKVKEPASEKQRQVFMALVQQFVLFYEEQLGEKELGEIFAELERLGLSFEAAVFLLADNHNFISLNRQEAKDFITKKFGDRLNVVSSDSPSATPARRRRSPTVSPLSVTPVSHSNLEDVLNGTNTDLFLNLANLFNTNRKKFLRMQEAQIKNVMETFLTVNDIGYKKLLGISFFDKYFADPSLSKMFVNLLRTNKAFSEAIRFALWPSHLPIHIGLGELFFKDKKEEFAGFVKQQPPEEDAKLKGTALLNYLRDNREWITGQQLVEFAKQGVFEISFLNDGVPPDGLIRRAVAEIAPLECKLVTQESLVAALTWDGFSGFGIFKHNPSLIEKLHAVDPTLARTICNQLSISILDESFSCTIC